MDAYEALAEREVAQWLRRMEKRPGLMKRMARASQQKINQRIPETVQLVLTEAVKRLVQATLFGSEFLTKKRDVSHLSLAERDQKVKDALSTYNKLAAAEGAGTGAGGILLGLADFPLLLGIKMKFLFDAATIYGFPVEEYEERLFILHVFQLAFSSDERRAATLHIVTHWDEVKDSLKGLDWRTFQQEYRDYIDLVKLLQMVPGIGAVVGAYANYRLLNHLGEVAMNAYRMRLLKARVPT